MSALVFFLMGLLGWSGGRPIKNELSFSAQQTPGRKLHEVVQNCTKSKELKLSEYPSVVVSLPDPLNMVFKECGGVLLSTDSILTSTDCIGLEIIDGDPLNKTFDNLLAEIYPYCSHGEVAEVLQVLGYHFMEDDYSGHAKHGSALSVLELKENVTSLTKQDLPALRKKPLPVGSIVTMRGYVPAKDNEVYNQNYSRPLKEIKYKTISDDECMRYLNVLQHNDKLDIDEKTETCALVEEPERSNFEGCNVDFGNPLYDSDGNVAGVITWQTTYQCDYRSNQTLPMVFADLGKPKYKKFITKTETQSLYTPPNITDGCDDNQSLQAAPWSISIQFPYEHDPTDYVHKCGGVLIDNGTKVLTAAQCLWDDYFQSPGGPLLGGNTRPTEVFDIRRPEKPQNGTFNQTIFAALAPRCRHFNGIYPRKEINEYWIHPSYNGNPEDGNNIAILGLKEQFSPDQSFPNFEEFLKSVDDQNLPKVSQFSDVTFYGWGAETVEEARYDEKGFFNNYFPAKEISMELIPEEKCPEKWIYLEDRSRVFHNQSELCVDQFSNGEWTFICQYDQGGPLVGKISENNQLVLLGLKSGPIDRKCRSYEIFTDVIDMKDFILRILDLKFLQPKPKIQLKDTQKSDKSSKNNPQNTLFIVLAVVGGSFVLIIFIALLAWRRRTYNKKDNNYYTKQPSQQLYNEGLSNLSEEFIKLSKDSQHIHSMLGNIANKQKNPDTGKARRHSDLAVSIDFMLSKDKVQTQILGYTKYSMDDSFLGVTRGAVPTSPFLLSAMQQEGDSPSLEFDNYPLYKVQSKGQNERIQNLIQISMDLNFGSGLEGMHNNNNSSKGLILSDTPAREDLDMKINFDEELRIDDRLGSGASGAVYKAVWLTRNIEVAVKIVHSHVLEQFIHDQKQVDSFFSSFIGELSLLGRIDNPHIVKCYGGSLKPPNVCLVLEYLPNGNLDKFIHQYVGDIPLGLIMRVAQGIAEGLDALHPTVVHRDLKPSNVLLDDSYQVKLADFGMSKMKEDTYLSKTMIKGTAAYIAPETFQEQYVDEKCDIYALGLIMWEMVTKQHPWEDLTLPIIMARVAIKGERPPIPDKCPSEIKRLIQRCWAENPKERPSAQEVVQRLAILRRRLRKGSTSDMGFQQKQTGQSKFSLMSQVLSYSYSQFTIESSRSAENNV